MIPKSLEYFSVIYAQRSLSKASAQLGISQPALSKSLRALEEELGAPLFLRQSWGLEPTKFGQTLIRHTGVIAEQFTALGRDIHAQLHAQLGSVQVGTNLAAATALIPNATLSLASIRPGIRLRVTEGPFESLMGGVLSGALDLAITTMPAFELPTALNVAPLFEDPFLVAMAKNHPLVSYQPEENVSVLLGYPWVLPPDEGVLRARIVEIFKKFNSRAPIPRVETFSLTALIELVCNGRYLTFQPKSVLRSRIAKPHLSWIDHPELRIERSVICIWKNEGEFSPAAAEFRDVVISEAKKIRLKTN